MSPKKMWETAVAEEGLELEFDTPGLAVSRRHMLHRYRAQVNDDALFDFHIQLVGKRLRIIPIGRKVQTLDGSEVVEQNPFAAAAKRLKVDL